MLELVLIPIAIAAFIWFAVSLLLSWENRRFAFSRMKQRCKVRRREHRTQLTVPCKGDDGDLEENLRAFFLQTHPNFELVLVVESETDPALVVIKQLQAEFIQQDCRVVVAGIAGGINGDGQKVHNLRAATASIPADIKLLAFADADIKPDRDWLQTLCFSVCKAKDAAANTGYRWMVPGTYTLTNLLVYSINATIAGTMGSGGHLLIWGGSWAIRRNNFERLGIHDDWKETLSDDLVASRTIRKHGERIIYDPRCLCSTRFSLSTGSAVEFLRRQYLIGRKYAPQMFWSSWFVLAINVCTWWALLIGATMNSGGFGSNLWLATIVLYGSSVAKGVLRQSVFRRRNPVQFSEQRLACLFDILAGPIVQTANFLLMSSVLVGSRIWWRGNHYLIKNGGKIQLLNPKVSHAGPIGLASEPSVNSRAA